MQLEDGVGVELEGPREEGLNALAPKKDFQRELLNMVQLAEGIRREHPYQKLAGTVTQFVVGAVGDTDHELLSLSNRLYRQYGLTRAYYSGFSPVIQTPFENLPPTDPLREHPLYQTSFLLRDYGWNVEDLPFMNNGNMQLELDPNSAWTDLHLRYSPIDVMKANREQLLRIPGIGPVGADAIIKARRQERLTDLAHLRKLNIKAPEQAAPYILLDGRKPSEQMRLL